ncbi:YciI family protein [Duganella sp. Dugasp56]|uniref:YciI family protein n=1 Tax=Duganella sp. Dugasp56 TaxID=3243046 RepID=UPI0039B0E54B
MKFTSYINYAAAPALITASRAQHRAYLATLFEERKLLLAGPFSDDSGAMLVFEAEHERQVRDWIEADPFFVAGIFVDIDTRPWKSVFANVDALRVPA